MIYEVNSFFQGCRFDLISSFTIVMFFNVIGIKNPLPLVKGEKTQFFRDGLLSTTFKHKLEIELKAEIK